MKPKPIRVNVTARDCREGKAGDCFHCPVARALQRATGDNEANVTERDYQFYLEAWGRLVGAPRQAHDVICDTDGGCNPQPTRFTLPPLEEWQEACSACQVICEQNELNEEGYCPDCAAKL